MLRKELGPAGALQIALAPGPVGLRAARSSWDELSIGRSAVGKLGGSEVDGDRPLHLDRGDR